MKIINWIKDNKFLIIILIIGAFFRLYKIDFQDAWLDEIHTLKESDPNLSLKEFSDNIMFREGISHFYFLLVRILFEVVGQSIVYARLISVFFGILSIFLIYKIGKKLFNNETGLFASLFMSFNLTHIEYSQEARTYSMYLFFVLLSIFHLLIFIEKKNYKNAIKLGISSGLIVNSHPIGLLNIAVIFVTLMILIIFTKSNQEKIKFFKQSFLSGLITLLVSIPVYLTLKKTSQINSFWVQAPTFNNIKNVFVDLTGKSITIFYTSFIFFLLFVIVSVYIIFNKKEFYNRIRFNLFFLLFWFIFCSSVLIVKSYTGTSLILNRYFISILPVLILINALLIGYIRIKYLKIFIVFAFIFFSCYLIFISKNYYNTITKSQFSSVSQEMINKNTNSKVFSSWGWLLSYYINQANSNQLITEMNFDDYLAAVRTNAVKTEHFWYMDGNSRPFSLTAENQEYLNKNFNLVYSIDKFDAWAKYYKPIISSKSHNKPSEITLYNNDFKPLFIDGSGNLMIFENSEVKSGIVFLETGNYNLLLKGNSLPSKRIKNENAHITIKVDGNIIGNIFLSENPANNKNTFPFKIEKNKSVQISLIFDNDMSYQGLDRNVKISSIKIIEK